MAKVENGNKVTEGLCMKCAKELGIPVETMLGNVMDKMGIPTEMLENMEGDMNSYLEENGLLPSDNDDNEDGGAPAIPLPQLFENPTSKPTNKETPMGNLGGANREKKEKGKRYKFLDTYCRNLTRRAAEGKLDKIVGRERELDRVIQILCRRQKNNPCLIGEPGVGKTAIAEALAHRGRARSRKSELHRKSLPPRKERC